MFLETQQPEPCADVVSPRSCVASSLVLIHPWFVFAALEWPRSSSSCMLSSSERSGYLNLPPVLLFPADELPVFSRNFYSFRVPDGTIQPWTVKFNPVLQSQSQFLPDFFLYDTLMFIPQPCFLCHSKGMN